MIIGDINNIPRLPSKLLNHSLNMNIAQLALHDNYFHFPLNSFKNLGILMKTDLRPKNCQDNFVTQFFTLNNLSGG